MGWWAGHLQHGEPLAHVGNWYCQSLRCPGEQPSGPELFSVEAVCVWFYCTIWSTQSHSHCWDERGGRKARSREDVVVG